MPRAVFSSLLILGVVENSAVRLGRDCFILHVWKLLTDLTMEVKTSFTLNCFMTHLTMLNQNSRDFTSSYQHLRKRYFL